MQALIISNILLWVLLIGLAFTLMGLVRQIGILHSRIAPAGALMLDKGVEINEPAPKVTAADRNGKPVAFGYAADKAQLLFFLSPSCPICKSLLPAVKAIARDQSERLDVVYISDGDQDKQQALINEFKLQDSTYVVGPEVGMTYQIGKLPYAVLIDQQGVLRAKGLVNSREHLDSLFEAQLMGFGSLQDFLYHDAAKPAPHAH